MKLNSNNFVFRKQEESNFRMQNNYSLFISSLQARLILYIQVYALWISELHIINTAQNTLLNVFCVALEAI